MVSEWGRGLYGLMVMTAAFELAQLEVVFRASRALTLYRLKLVLLGLGGLGSYLIYCASETLMVPIEREAGDRRPGRDSDLRSHKRTDRPLLALMIGGERCRLPRWIGCFARPSPAVRGGLGIGLYQCKKIVEAHGGTIYLQSKEGRGTQVRTELPLRTGGDREPITAALQVVGYNA